jgi:hypothetical protein
LIEKPKALWGWSLPTGQGDLYQYPTMHSPFIDRAPWRIWVSIARALNGPLALLMVLGAVQSLLKIRNAIDAGTVSGVSSEIPARCVLLVFYVTMVYCALQAEPRYFIAVRGAEFTLALLAAGEAFRFLRGGLRKPAATHGQTSA